jgi:polyisoprenoid-binding protein YceI
MHRFIIVAEDSQVSYSVEEIFISHNNKHVTAVGTTHDVSGEAFYDPDNPQNSTLGAFTVDISTFQSDSNNRDRAIRERWLESTKYPIARFEPTSIEGLPESYTEGEEMTLLITGDLTVHDTTRSVTFETTGFIEDNTMVGTATTTIQMSDFGFEPPRLAGIVETKDSAHIRFDFVAQAE